MAEELKKIHLNTQTSNRTKRGKTGKIILTTVIAVLVVIVLVVGVLAIMLMPLRNVYGETQKLTVSAKELSTAIKSQDLEKSKTALVKTQSDLAKVDTEYQKVMNLKMLPFIGVYIKDGDHGLKAAKAGLGALDNAIAALEPNADLLGLKVGSKFVQGSANERIQTAVKTMKALTPKINLMAENIDIVRKELAQIDESRYPESFKGTKIRSQIITIKDVVDNAAGLFVNAQPLLTSLPAILGEPTERRYLILFQNDKELRPTGGFITAYALFLIKQGKITLEKADDIYALDATIKKNIPAPEEILKFHKDVFVFHIRDSNLSPDYKVSMQKFLEIYAATNSEKNINGIIALDTHVLVEALKILGPINVYGREFSGAIDKRCDCPKAVYELEDYSTRQVNYWREARKDIIGVLLQQIMLMALGVSPSKYWGNLFQMVISEINQKHVLAYFIDPTEQKAAESFNMAGRIMSGTEIAPVFNYQEQGNWDYLHINNSNMAGAKSNMFVSEAVTKDITINSNNTMTTKLTINYKNPYPYSDCNVKQEVAGLCLNAILRNWVRVYVPKGSKLLDSNGAISPKDGKTQPMNAYDGLGKPVFEGFLLVNPMGTAKLELTYTSPISEKEGKYRLLIQKQPGTDGQEYTIKINGKDRKKLTLLSDTEIIL